MFYGGGRTVRYNTGLGLGRLPVRDVRAPLGRSGRWERYMLCFSRSLARVLGRGLLRRGLLLHVLPL